MPDDYKPILDRMYAMVKERGLSMEPHHDLDKRLFNNGSGDLPGSVGSLDYVVDGSHGQIRVLQSLNLQLRGTKGSIVNRVTLSDEPLTVWDALASKLYLKPDVLTVLYEKGEEALIMEVNKNGRIKPASLHANLIRGKPYEKAFAVMLDLVQGKQQLPI